MDVIAFWLVALMVSAAALPLAFIFMRRLPDGGAGLSLPLGLVLVGFSYFTLRVLDVLHAGRGGYLLVFGALIATGILVARHDRRFASTFRRSAPAIIALSGLFTLLFFGYVGFRSYTAEIAGTEQPMDFLYLNATLTSPEYPPQDPWLAGEPASYYYMGYLNIGFLTAVSGTPASTGYNLGLAVTFAAAGVGAASLGFALVRWIAGARARQAATLGGALTLVLLLGVGSLTGVFEWATAHGHTNRGLYEAFGVEYLLPCDAATPAGQDCLTPTVNDRWYPTEYWFWWRGTRVIPETITEFPFFSFLLGDLHPHVMAIPFGLLVLGIAAAAYRGRSSLSFATLRRQPLLGVVLGLVLGALAFMNAWDLPTFAAIFALAVLARNLRRASAVNAIMASAGYVVPILMVAVVAYLPWYLDFNSQAGLIQPYTGVGTRPAHVFTQFGPLLLAGLLVTVWGLRGVPRPAVSNAFVLAAWVPLVPLFGWLLLAAGHDQLTSGVEGRTGGGWVTLAIYCVITWLLTATAGALARVHRPAAIPAAFAALAALLLLGTELFYIKDIFADATPRLNTVFKLSYQAWALLAVAGGASMAIALRGARRDGGRLTVLASLPVFAIAAAGLAYAVIAVPNRTDDFTGETAIDGLDFLARNNPDEYALHRWVGTAVDPGDILIEATGRTWARNAEGQAIVTNGRTDYSLGGRISARTGRPNAMGWYFHEVQWRGDDELTRAALQERVDTVDRIYLSDAATAYAAIRDFGARYVVVGELERSAYPADMMTPFETFLEVAWEQGNYRVYEVPGIEVFATS